MESEIYNFTIKNYEDSRINSIYFFYQFEVIGIDDNISFQLWNISENEMIELKDGKTDFFSIGFDKEEIKYCIIVDLLNSNIEDNKNINIKINTKFNE